MNKKILVVDDELAKGDESQGFAEKYGFPEYEYLFAKDRGTALQVLGAHHDISLILLDIVFDNMDEKSGFEDIKRISTEIWPSGKESLSGNEYGLPMLDSFRAKYPDIPIVMLSSKRVPSILLWCWKHGASYYIIKPPEGRETMKRCLDGFSRYVQASLIIGKSPAVKMLREQILLASASESSVSVLITGESGTGKELIARSIHQTGQRRNRPFVIVNCAAIPENLMESELFGHKKGSFTGASSDKKGKLREADGGVVFFDEIGDLSLELQAKVLRAMARGMRFSAVGATEEQECDVQIIAATNKNLDQEVNRGTFREDLYYRLNVFPIHVPPLRERREDIALLANHFLALFKSRQYRSKVNVEGFTEDVMSCLSQYEWPGNIRELENVVEYALVRTGGNFIDVTGLPERLLGTGRTGGIPTADLKQGFNLNRYLAQIRWGLIKSAYEIEMPAGQHGIIERIAVRLGIANPSDIQRTILPQIKELCPELTAEITSMLPKRPRAMGGG